MFWQKFDNKYRSNTAEQPFHSAWLNLEYPILARLAVRMNWLNMRDKGQQDWKIDQTKDKGWILQDGATRMRLHRNNLLSTRLGKRRGSGSLIWGWQLRIGVNVAGAFPAPALRVSMEISLPTTANSNYSLLYLLATPKFIVKSVHIGIYLV